MLNHNIEIAHHILGPFGYRDEIVLRDLVSIAHCGVEQPISTHAVHKVIDCLTRSSVLICTPDSMVKYSRGPNYDVAYEQVCVAFEAHNKLLRINLDLR